MLNLAVQTLFRHETSVQTCFFSGCILRPIRPITMTKHVLQDHFMEIREIH